MPLLEEYRFFIFNTQSLLLGKSFPQPLETDYPKLQFKYGGLEYVYKHTTGYVRAVLDACGLQNKHKYVVVDVKVSNIESNKPPCLAGWHCDTVIDPFDNTQPEHHHLFVTGSASLTEFIAEPVELAVSSNLQHQVLLHSFRQQLAKKQFAITKIPSCQITTYGRFDFHRGSLGLFNERRLLIRVTETDIIVPKNRPTN